MNTLRASMSPRSRLWLAGVLILGLAVLGPLGGMTMASAARWLLGLAVLGGLGWWLHRRGSVSPGRDAEERMRVVSRAGLSPRCGLALVEVDGRGFLVAFGDSFAEIHETREREQVLLPAIAQARRPRPGRRVLGRRKGVAR